MKIKLCERMSLGGSVYHYEVIENGELIAHSDEIAHWEDPGLVELDKMYKRIQKWVRKQTTTPKCRGKLAYEVVHGTRVYRKEDGKRLYRARCTVCNSEVETNGRRKTCPQEKSG